ncbi:hypothetical protein ACNKHO_06240 [Shigella flexneri]
MAMPGNDPDDRLADDSLNGFSDMWLRLSRHLPESALFRHAVRMSLVLCIGLWLLQSRDCTTATGSCF